ncbi:MAG: Arc family DNA binding domain-containing protein [Lutimonas sp.]
MSKKAFALRMDSEIFKAVELWAKDEYRSVNGQIEYILYKALKEARRMNPEKDL